MAKNIEELIIKLNLKGFAGLKNIGQDIKNLQKKVQPTAIELDKLVKEITKIGGATRLSNTQFEGQIGALTKLQNNVGAGTKAYQRLGQEINNLKGKMVTAIPPSVPETIKLTSSKLDRLVQGITNVHHKTLLSKNSFEGQISALTRLRNNVGIGTVAYVKLSAELDRVKAKMDAATAAAAPQGGIFARLNQGLGKGGTAALGGAVSRFLPQSAQIGGIAGYADAGLSGAVKGVGIGLAVDAAAGTVGFAKEAAEYTASLDKAKIALRGITKDQASFEIALRAANRATEEFNVPQEVAIKGMQRLSAAVLGAGGNINNAEEAFLNTVAAIKATGGTADDVKSALTAMVQIFSKGKVSAEELSGQLGERFPGAVTKFANANNMTTQALQESLKNGTVGLDMLSKFIASLGEEYIPIAKEIAKSNAEAGARLVVATNKMRLAVGENFKDIGAEFQILQAELLTDLAPAFGEVAKIAVAGFKVLTEVLKFVVKSFADLAIVVSTVSAAFATLKLQLMITKIGGLGAAILALKVKFVALIGSIKVATLAQLNFNRVALANPYVALAAGITAAIGLLLKFRSTQKGLVDDTEESIKKLSGLSKDQLKAEIENAKKKREELIKERDNVSGDVIRKIDINRGKRFRYETIDEKQQRDEITEKIKAQNKYIENAQGTLTLVGGNAEFPSLKGANERTEKLISLNKNLNNAVKERNVLGQLIYKREIALEKLTNKFDKKKTGKEGQETLSKKDQQDFDTQKEAILLGFKKDSTAQVEKELTIRRNLLVELGLMTEKAAEKEEIEARARDIARNHKDLLDEQGISVDSLVDKLTDAKKATFNFKESFKELYDSVTDLGTNIGEYAIGAVDQLADSFVDLMVTGKASFADLARSILQDLQRMILKALFFKTLFKFVPGLEGFLNFEKGGAIDKGKTVENAKGNVFAQNKILPYASGGVIDKPVIFPMAKGIGLAGEAGPEGILPLKRGRDGKLGVIAQGGGTSNIVVNVDASGSSVEGDEQQGKELGRLIAAAVQSELIQQKRPGGLLA